MEIPVVDDLWTVRVKFKNLLSDKGFIAHETENGLEAIDIPNPLNLLFLT